MSFTILLHYTGKNGAARKFAQEMESSGIAAAIRRTPGNTGYAYYQPLDDPQTILLVDSWENQEALDRHHASANMKKIADLRDKYDLHMKAERFVSADKMDSQKDEKYIRQ